MALEQPDNVEWLFTHFFHFFEIPHFIPKDYEKYLLSEWNKYFDSREELATDIEAKENLFEQLNIDDILSTIYNITNNCNTTANRLKYYIELFEIQTNNLYGYLQNIYDITEEYAGILLNDRYS